MVVIKVVAMFDDPSQIETAKAELLRSGLATEESVWVELDAGDDAETPSSVRSAWERLKEHVAPDDEHDASAYAEGLRRGSALLVVETPTEQAERVKDVLRTAGAIDLRRRVHRWITTGWEAFEPDAPRFTELELLDERRARLSEVDIAAAGGMADGPDATISIFDEKTGQLLGRISEAELAVLQDALEEEGPDDDDYWINPEEIETISGRPGATPHLIALLRRAVGNNSEGADIRFERAR
ncbi:MAG TPA: hypothetical protein VN634_16255 [Candidatus Limnocylindrales bacterium]|nr:hypothetical protein [Candidatus Limnocylindrales bacterium]